jgi:hypothetical protein
MILIVDRINYTEYSSEGYGGNQQVEVVTLKTHDDPNAPAEAVSSLALPKVEVVLKFGNAADQGRYEVDSLYEFNLTVVTL